MSLAQAILMHDPRQDVELRGSPAELALVPPHKSLFNAPASHGLPIGNLSSQFFANVLLDDLDQHVKHRLRAPAYVRYVDDLVLLHPSPQWLNAALASIEGKLAELHMQLNPRKTILQPVARGIDFVGHLVRPFRRSTRPRTLNMALVRLEHMPADDLYTSANSYLGLVRQAGASHHEQARVARVLLKRGHVVDGDLSRVFKRHV
jgi:RNA-directed DNA polymerase